MILQRLNSVAVLGVFISPNMEINVFVSKLKEGLNLKPELFPVFEVLMNPVLIAQVMSTQILQKNTLIITTKRSLALAKSTLELAVKAYNVGATIAMKLLDAKPAVNGSPPATGAEVALAPLKNAVEQATERLQELENQLEEYRKEFIELVDEYEPYLKKAKAAIISKIAELGNKNITV